MKHVQMFKPLLFSVFTFFSFFTQIHAQFPVPPVGANCNVGCSCSTSYATPCQPGNPTLPCQVMACSTTGNYNCHQFTRMLNESTNPCNNSSSGINADNRYIRVCDANAPMVYYSTDHSAVRQIDGTYVSKWNCNGDLMRHTRDYYPGNQEFYVYVGGINTDCPLTSGTCTLTQARTFSLLNVAGLGYSWSVSNSAFATISGSGSSVTVTPVCPGTFTLSVTVTGCGQFPKTQSMTIVSNPTNPGPNCCFTGTYSTSSSLGLPLNTTNAVPVGTITATINDYPGASCFQWTKTSGSNIPYYVYNNGRNIQFSMGSGQSISFSVAAKRNTDANCNGGSVLCTRSITFYQSTWGMVVQEGDGPVSDSAPGLAERDASGALQAAIRPYPNPSNGEINIKSTLGADFTVQMFDLVGNMLLENKFPAGTELVTLQAPEEIRQGLVILKISDGKQSATYKQWIIRN